MTDLERGAEGKRAGNNKVSRRRERKRVKNEDKHAQTERAEIGAGLSEFASMVTGPARSKSEVSTAPPQPSFLLTYSTF